MRWKQRIFRSCCTYQPSKSVPINRSQHFDYLLAHRLVSQLCLVWLHSAVVICACTRTVHITSLRDVTGRVAEGWMLECLCHIVTVCVLSWYQYKTSTPCGLSLAVLPINVITKVRISVICPGEGGGGGGVYYSLDLSSDFSFCMFFFPPVSLYSFLSFYNFLWLFPHFCLFCTAVFLSFFLYKFFLFFFFSFYYL